MVRNTSGNGPGLPIQVINLPGGRPCIVLSVEDFAALLSLAHEGAAREVMHHGTRRNVTSFAAGTRHFAVAKAEGALRNLFLDDDAMTHTERFIDALFADPHHASLSATLGVTEPLMPLPDDDAEDAADFAAYQEAKARDEEAFPLAVAQRLVAGEHPIKVFREHRGITQAKLADQAGLSAMYLSQIETRRRGGSTKTLRRIAAALDVDLADLVV